AKLLAGLYRACEKTPVTSLELEKMVDGIEQELYACGDQEVRSTRIGELVMDNLARINEVAYVRFASVYRRFKDIASFEKQLSLVKQGKHIPAEDVKKTELFDGSLRLLSLSRRGLEAAESSIADVRPRAGRPRNSKQTLKKS